MMQVDEELRIMRRINKRLQAMDSERRHLARDLLLIEKSVGDLKWASSIRRAINELDSEAQERIKQFVVRVSAHLSTDGLFLEESDES